MAFKVLVFVQGRGWIPASEITDHNGVVDSEMEAIMLGSTLVLENIKKKEKAHGSSIGDLVGFRVELSNEEPQPISRRLESWESNKHLFFRKDNSYMLYKTWSWPD